MGLSTELLLQEILPNTETSAAHTALREKECREEN